MSDITKEQDPIVRFYEAIQGSISEDENLEGSVLLQFAMIAEWQSPEGGKWLTKLSGDASGQLPPWRERMLGSELASWDYMNVCSCQVETEEDE